MGDSDTKRWMYVIFTFIIFICSGSVYNWSMFRIPLEQLFSISPIYSLLPFMLLFVMIVFSFILSTSLVKKHSIRLIIFIGCILYSMGWITCFIVTDMLLLTISFGVFCGVGTGILMNGLMTVIARWFPDERGGAIGITLFGAGISPVITAPILQTLIDSSGVLTAMGLFGGGILVIMLLCCIPMKLPVAGWTPQKNSNKQLPTEDVKSSLNDSIRFWPLWICFFIGIVTGFMAVGTSSSFGQEIFGLSAGMSSLYLGWFAFCGASSRVAYGYLFDKKGIRYSMMMILIILLIGTLIISLFLSTQSIWVFLITFSIFWSCFSGLFTLVMSCKGQVSWKKISLPLHHALFTAIGASAIISTIFEGLASTSIKTYTTLFTILLALTFFGLILSFFTIKHIKTKPTPSQ